MFVRRKRIFNATIYYFLQFLGVIIIYALFFSVLALEHLRIQGEATIITDFRRLKKMLFEMVSKDM